jgi:List-Bact-rpt repeat protein/PASTA domain-containing protein
VSVFRVSKEVEMGDPESQRLFGSVSGRLMAVAVAIAVVVAALTASLADASQVGPFVGTWENDSSATLDQTRAVIGVNGANFEVSGYGACVPTDCDWAASVGGPRTTPQADASDGQLSIVWEFGFKTTTQTLILLPDGRLHITSFHHYTDSSGRPDRTSNEDFHKTTAPAVFYALSVAASGRGKITSTPAGIECPAACSLEYPSGSSVVLTAAPQKGSRLVSWKGACLGKSLTCTVNVAGDTSATAIFAPNPRCIVPALKRKTLAAARRALSAAHCRLAKVRRAYSRVSRGRILAQSPAAGTRLANGGSVSVVVSRGSRR